MRESGSASLHVVQPKLHILFVCTHNRCRSILAEALARHLGGGLLQASSAGSEPAGAVHPLTLAALKRHGVPVEGLHSKSLEQLQASAQEQGSPDVVITVCDQAAESCPLWSGPVPRVHWGLPDPSALAANADACTAAFDETIAVLSKRLCWLKEGLEQGLDRASLLMLARALSDSRQHAA